MTGDASNVDAASGNLEAKLCVALREAGQVAVNAMMGEDAMDTCAYVESTMLAVLSKHGVTGNVVATSRGGSLYHVDVTDLAYVNQ